MSTTESAKRSTPRSRAYAAISAAKKALKEGKTGASARLDKAIRAYAKSVCKIKAVKGAKRKLVVASVSGRKKAGARKTTARKRTTTKRK
jgi:hypothetical protein